MRVENPYSKVHGTQYNPTPTQRHPIRALRVIISRVSRPQVVSQLLSSMVDPKSQALQVPQGAPVLIAWMRGHMNSGDGVVLSVAAKNTQGRSFWGVGLGLGSWGLG